MRRGRNGDQADSADGLGSPQAARPTIGLALGGGAARGFSHIGVLRTLLAKGIKPDIIAGTSIGAVVGGCYAAGYLDALEDWARHLTRRSVFSYLDFNIGGSGLIGGGRLSAKLEGELGDLKIQDLPVRMAAIATEIGTGHEIWLTRGRLVEAMSASYALPGIFPPVRIGGRWLMDGVGGARVRRTARHCRQSQRRQLWSRHHHSRPWAECGRRSRAGGRHQWRIAREGRTFDQAAILRHARSPGNVDRDDRGLSSGPGSHHARPPGR